MNRQIVSVLPSIFRLLVWGNPTGLLTFKNLKDHHIEEEADLFAVALELGQMVKTEDIFYLRFRIYFLMI